MHLQENEEISGLETKIQTIIGSKSGLLQKAILFPPTFIHIHKKDDNQNRRAASKTDAYSITNLTREMHKATSKTPFPIIDMHLDKKADKFSTNLL